MRIDVIPGRAVLLVDDEMTYGIEFPEYGDPGNPTQPWRLGITFNPSVTIGFAKAVVDAIIGLKPKAETNR